ncbi:phage integrase SAM-like domain-containing protein [Mucilaginibacter sp. L196]|uniref:phage integrase SAM-like domain-containing protein n=1 Tax=Mucilaginibacter sp. L196 TaxID=1641870 RepID=UPI00131E9817
MRFLENFESWLRNEKKLKDTSISVKIGNIQRVVNLDIAYKFFKQENYPFGVKKYSVNKLLFRLLSKHPFKICFTFYIT